MEKLEAGELVIPGTKPLTERFKALKLELRRLEGLGGSQLFDAIFPQNTMWAEPFSQIKIDIEGKENIGPSELLALMRQHITQPELPTDVDYIRIMSLHKSKGLTAKLVVVLGCLEGLIPSLETDVNDSEYSRNVEEQRRLFYVAITRAKRCLVISSVASLPTDVAHKMRAKIKVLRRNNSPTIASRFFSELGPSCPDPITGDNFLRLANCETKT